MLWRVIILIKMMPIRIRMRLAILILIQIRVWIPDWHQNNADLNADPSPSFAHFGKLGLIFLLLFCCIGRLKYISFFTWVANVLWFLCNCEGHNTLYKLTLIFKWPCIVVWFGNLPPPFRIINGGGRLSGGARLPNQTNPTQHI